MQEKKTAKQGAPVITSMDQAAAVKAILTDSKISDGLYNAKRIARTEEHRIRQTSTMAYVPMSTAYKSLSRSEIRLFDALYSTLIFLPYSVIIIKVAGVRLPAHLCGA